MTPTEYMAFASDYRLSQRRRLKMLPHFEGGVEKTFSPPQLCARFKTGKLTGGRSLPKLRATPTPAPDPSRFA